MVRGNEPPRVRTIFSTLLDIMASQIEQFHLPFKSYFRSPSNQLIGIEQLKPYLDSPNMTIQFQGFLLNLLDVIPEQTFHSYTGLRYRLEDLKLQVHFLPHP